MRPASFLAGILVRRRAVWLPTWLGWSLLVILIGTPAIWWLLAGESFLAVTERMPAEVLVVEGWIGREGTQAAAVEFQRQGYKFVIATGGTVFSSPWQETPINYAEMAAGELIRNGIPKDQVILAKSEDAKRDRTYESAMAVFRTLESKAISHSAINVFTLGAHARRSRLVYSKVGGKQTKVGVISWRPTDYTLEPWWQSSERAKDFISETDGYPFELLLNSGRGTIDAAKK
jgi:hypothetical protein